MEVCENWLIIKERYLRDELPIRLGGLAANLSRIKSFSDHIDHCHVVESLLEESKYFIEWTTLDAELDIQVKLIELQIKLSRWHFSWTDIWSNPLQRMEVAEQARFWSDQILNISEQLKAKMKPQINT